MSRIARYLTHPQVRIDPEKDVMRWSLNDTGRTRVAALVRRIDVLAGTTRVISSDEVKARETAAPLAEALGAALDVRPRMHENDRSATGFLPPAEFERTADQFFAHPALSVRGWETARDAQARILAEVEAALAAHGDGDILFVGHGGVGTLLFCALSGHAIDRRFDQGPGGGGSWFEFDIDSRRPGRCWQPLEAWFD